jgi:hypothetical protein
MKETMPTPDMIPVFAATKLKLHPEKFTLVSLPLSEKDKALELFKEVSPFSTISVDHSEVSLVLSVQDWMTMQGNFEQYKKEGPYKAITFDIVLDLNLIGFLSIVSAILAEEKISIFAVSTFLRDHILVKEDEHLLALQVLNNLIQRCNTH